MIEIDFKQIPTWLQQRNKLNSEWPKKYRALILKQEEILGQAKSAYTYQELEEELTKLKNSDEGNQKTLFGGFSSKTIKTLDNLLKLFQKDNLHLVNMGQSLVQIMTYDIPGIKKQLILTDQQLQNQEQRIGDSQTSILTYKEQFLKQCKKLGIEGNQIEIEVPNMILQIPILFEEIEQLALKNNTLQNAIEYYRQFSIYQNSQLEPLSLIINLESFIQHGNGKAQEWEIIEAPKSEEIDWMKYIQPQQVNIQDSDLLNQIFRNNLIIDLYELIEFYNVRLNSLKQNQGIAEIFQQHKIFEISQQEIIQYLDILRKLLSLLINPRLIQLLQLKSSIKNQQRIISNLEEYDISIRKCESNIINSQNKIQDLKQEQIKLKNQLQELQNKVKSMKNYTEILFNDVFKTEIKLIGCEC